jgi:hypothetical protein
LLRGKGLPALQTQQGGVWAEHGAVRQTKAGGAIEELPATDLVGPGQKAHQQAATAGAGFPAGWSHVDQVPSGIELKYRLWIGGTDRRKLFRA